jgi:hypothetical protein
MQCDLACLLNALQAAVGIGQTDRMQAGCTWIGLRWRVAHGRVESSASINHLDVMLAGADLFQIENFTRFVIPD